MEGENSTSGPQPYQPYEAVTNSPISNKLRALEINSQNCYYSLNTRILAEYANTR